MINFAVERIVYIPGRHGDYQSPARGQAAVEYDGRTYLYRVKKGERREFRQWAENAFSKGLTPAKIEGKWPHYSVRFS